MERFADPSRQEENPGFALVIVLLVLVALLSLATPYLLSTRQENQSTSNRVYAGRARLSALGAREHARRLLEDTHPSRDLTPLADSLDEISVGVNFSKEFFPADNPRGEIWSVQAEDEQGKFNINSAPPQVFARFAYYTRTLIDHEPEDTTIEVESTDGFPEEGFLRINGEIIQYLGKTETAFQECRRGILSENKLAYEPGNLEKDSLVLDDRLFGLAENRFRLEGNYRPYPAVRYLVEGGRKSLGGAMEASWVDRNSRWMTTFSGNQGAGTWGAPVRVRNRLTAGETVRLLVSSSRYFNYGTTIRIRGKGGKEEFGIVLDSNPTNGVIRLHSVTRNSYEPFEAEVEPLLRHPVNINTADPELIRQLLEGLQLRSKSSSDYVSRAEALDITNRIVALRPFGGWEEFVEKVLRPAREEEVISARDALVILYNALNADDAWLRFSSLPFTFASGDIYSLTATASINTPLGKEKARRTLHEVLSVAPQEPLLRLLFNQEGFEDQFRLTRRARQWLTGPANVGIYDGSNDPPSRSTSMAARGDDPIYAETDRSVSYASSAPFRKEEAAGQGKLEHFDASRNPEGLTLPGDPWKKSTLGGDVALAVAQSQSVPQLTSILYPGAVEGWFRSDSWNGILWDIGAGFTQRSRVLLKSEGGELIFQVFDDAGDDFLTPEIEATEVRFETANLPPKIWSHLSAFWQGSRPSDLMLMVDGARQGRNMGLTRLTGSLSAYVPGNSISIPVESTEGFPDRGVLRIGGSEIVEYTGRGPSSFDVTWRNQASGPVTQDQLYFGGRAARLGTDTAVILAADTNHEAGESVELYGYSAPLRSNIGAGGGKTAEDIGKFTAARLIAEESGQFWTLRSTGEIIGYGITRNYSGKWELGPLDNDQDFMDGFSKSGGYALVMQMRDGFQLNREDSASPGSQQSSNTFGIELISYTGWNGIELQGVQRGLSNVFQDLGNVPGYKAKSLAFITRFETPGTFASLNDAPCAAVLVIPITLPVTGVFDLAKQYDHGANTQNQSSSQVVQIYDENDESKTEWVQFEEIVTLQGAGSQALLAKTDDKGIEATMSAMGLFYFGDFVDGTAAACNLTYGLTQTEEAVPGKIGENEITEDQSPVHAIWKSLKFRGVLGTFPHPHSKNEEIIPVFHTVRQNTEAGPRPGRNDRVAVMTGPTGQAGGTLPTADWKTINWAWYPSSEDLPGVNLNRVYVAFKQQPTLPVAFNYVGSQVEEDSRSYARILKFPSGELGTFMEEIALGDGHQGGGPNFAGEVDEVEFLSQSSPGTIHDPTSLGRYILAADMPQSETQRLFLRPKSLSFSFLEYPYNNNVLTELPADAGLLMIGEEILAYVDLDPVGGEVTLAANGRGLLNTLPMAHGRGESVVFLPQIRGSELTAGVTPQSSQFAVEDVGKFSSQGTLLLDQELVHFLWKQGGTLLMPTRPLQLGEIKGRNRETGVFRGRYGTFPADHEQGSIAIQFPFRYWDRFAPLTDVAELSYLGTQVAAPGGYFGGLFWEEEPAVRDPHAHIVALARVDDWAGWQEVPEEAKGLFFLERPKGIEEGINPLGFAGNRLEVRFFTRYLPGAFDPQNFSAHSWKLAPKIRQVGIDYLAPIRVFRHTEGKW